MGYWLLSDDPMLMNGASIAAGMPMSPQAVVGLAPCTDDMFLSARTRPRCRDVM
jgi:hypothetical protein